LETWHEHGTAHARHMGAQREAQRATDITTTEYHVH